MRGLVFFLLVIMVAIGCMNVGLLRGAFRRIGKWRGFSVRGYTEDVFEVDLTFDGSMNRRRGVDSFYEGFSVNDLVDVNEIRFVQHDDIGPSNLTVVVPIVLLSLTQAWSMRTVSFPRCLYRLCYGPLPFAVAKQVIH